MAEHPTRTDAELLVAAVEDPREFLGIFERHCQSVHRFVARQLGAAAAEDATAEVFVRALRAAPSYAIDRPDARPWLFGIAVNVVRAELRERYDAGRPVSIETVQLEAMSQRDDDRLDGIARLSEARNALELLPLDEREPLLLFAWLDLTYEEIAVALSLPIGTVRSRIARARRRLRAELGLERLKAVAEGAHDS